MRFQHLLALAILITAMPVTAQTSDSAAVAQTVATFHAALATGDSAAALSLLAEDVLVLESGGLETRAEYRAHHLPADISFAQALPSTRTPQRIIVSGDVAWVVGTSQTTGTYRERTVNTTGAELIVLTRETAGWRIRAIHWSSRSARPSGGGAR